MVAPAVCQDSVEMPRLILAVAGAGGADPRELARGARLPDWVLALDGAMVASQQNTRLWELAEHALDDPLLGLTAADRHRVGDLDLYDYLFVTAATLRDGMRQSIEHFPLVSTNVQLRVMTETDRDVTYAYRHVLDDSRGEETWTQFSLAGFCARARAATGAPIVPAHVAFAQPPPRSYQAFVEAFGTRQIDFGAPATTLTFHTADLDRPMQRADPALARILRRHAATVSPPQPVTWYDRFQELLAEVIDLGSPSRDALARRLSISVSTLQRRLAEHGTTWRAELDAARQRRVQHARRHAQDDLARHLGYADPRSVRRAMSRWNDRDA
jgi:AraC-like DNA-binding protein